MGLEQCRIIQLPRFQDPSGDLTFIEGNHHIPFDIRRVYYIYGVPAGSQRGAHGHRELQQLIIALSGSFDVVLDDGRNKQCYPLNSPYNGLFVCPMMWRNLVNFSSGAVCMVLASEHYDKADYLWDYDRFLIEARGHET